MRKGELGGRLVKLMMRQVIFNFTPFLDLIGVSGDA